MDKKAIRIEIPSVKGYSRILRLAAAGAADASGFNLDMIEDVKVLVSEVFSSIIEANCSGAHISFKPDDGRLEVSFETYSGEPVLKGANDMTVPILEALAGSVIEETGGGLKLIIE